MKGNIIMKKLTLALSAIVAAFSASAKADISVSGSTGAAYVSNMASSNNTDLIVGSAVTFALSTTTASGMGISAGMGISLDPDANAVNSAITAGTQNPAVTGGNKVTFTTGGATIVVGDIELADTPGSIGGVVGGIVGDNNGSDTNVRTGFTDDDGAGVSLSTALGSATLNVGYITNDNGDNHAVINSNASGADALTAASISVPMGMYTISVGVADSDTGESSSGATVSAAIGGGTLAVGYSNQTMIAGTDLTTAGDSTVLGATYKMSLDADTSIALGYQNAKDADDDSTTRVDVSISRSLGGGASVYLDMRNLAGNATTKGTAIGFGTSVSF
jgi:hypothetical protein